MKTDFQQDHPSGFTVVEILVAVVIFSLVMMTLFSSFQAFATSGDHILSTVETNEQARAVFRRIRSDLLALSVLRPPRYQKPTFNSAPDPFRLAGSQDRVQAQPFSRFEFAALDVLGFTGPVRITYYAREDRQGRINLYRSQQPLANQADRKPDGTDPCRDPLLARGIAQFSLGFVDVDGNAVTEWDSDSERYGYGLPRIITVRLSLGDNSRPRIFETSLFIPVTREVPES